MTTDSAMPIVAEIVSENPAIPLGEIEAPLIKQLEVHAALLAVAVEQNDKQLVSRVLHHLPRFGSKLDASTLAQFAGKHCSDDAICKFLGEMPEASEKHEFVGISEIYAWLLLSYWLFKTQRYTELLPMASRGVELCASAGNSRVLDGIQAKLLFYLSLAYEHLGDLVGLRHRLMLCLRSTSLRHEVDSNAVVYNWILRSYVLGEQHDLAKKFVEHSPFPAGASGAQTCRFHYYLARIAAVQTDYVLAREHLTQAISRAPHADASTGFLQAAQKLLVLVSLLLGDVPERALFTQPRFKKALRGYYALCQAVRLGDLGRFQAVCTEYHAFFAADRTDSLVARLHQNVLRAGLKRLHQAYTRIPLADVAKKLGLPSVDDAQFVLLKAIKEGLIQANLDADLQCMVSAAEASPYYAQEAHAALHQRIQAAQQVCKQSAMAMRYPMKDPTAAKDTKVEEELPIQDEMDFLDDFMEDDGMDF